MAAGQPDDERSQRHCSRVIAAMDDCRASLTNGGDAVGLLEVGSE